MMSKWVITATAFVLALGCTAISGAELQNVEVGGSVDIYGAYYSGVYETNAAQGYFRYPILPGRNVGINGTFSSIRADNHGNNLAFVEERTRLHAKADFTDEITAFIELDACDIWGEDFRSNYLTGADARGGSLFDSDIEVFQAYIEAREMFGTPLQVRIGRQELYFGTGWLVGTNTAPDPFSGLSFDAVRLTWAADAYTIDAWWSKLIENSPVESDGDVDFYGIYASCTAVEDMTFDVYWMFLRDATDIEDQDQNPLGEWMEDIFSLDNYDVSSLHTVGLRTAGTRGPLDWEVEVAYQFGEAGQFGTQFQMNYLPLELSFGDDDASWDNWGGHVEVGYTFESAWTPRVYAGGCYYGGEDNRDMSFWDWVNPFRRPESSMSFNRLFSDYGENTCLDYYGAAMSNMWQLNAGVSMAPAEKIEVGLDAEYRHIIGAFDYPPYVSLGPWRLPIFPILPFITCEGEKPLDWHLLLWASYAYSEDLSFQAGWCHMFALEGLKDGAFVDANGTVFMGGRDDKDADYCYFETTLEF